MNVFGERCRSVLAIVEGAEPVFDAAVEPRRGFHCGCVLRQPPGPVRAGLLVEDFSRFCEASGIRHVVLTHAELTRRMRAGDPEAALSGLPGMTVVVCPTAAEYRGLCGLLLRPFADRARSASRVGVFCLLAMLELSQKAAVVEAFQSEVGWLRPPPGYESELRASRTIRCHHGAWEEDQTNENEKNDEKEENENENGGNEEKGQRCVVPVRMYSNYPILRDCGTSCADLTKGPNLCTLDAILRELAYKAGQLPKYGS